jgi:4-carboxymuconolactone decarboxylase
MANHSMVEPVENRAIIARERKMKPSGRKMEREDGGGQRLRRALTAYRKHTGRKALEIAQLSPADPDNMKELWDIMFASTYGDSWSRSGLSMRTKSFLCLAVTASLGLEREFLLHAKSAQRVGVTKSQLVEMLIHLSGYIGAPRVAVAAARLREMWNTAPQAPKPRRPRTG